MTAGSAKPGDTHWGVNVQYRAARLAHFLALVDAVVAEKGHCRVADLGGSAAYWLDMKPLWAGRKLSITLINLEAETDLPTPFESVAGDSCNLPGLADNSFDVVHSNSVIEHVGRWREMKAMAGEVSRLAPRYFVQTPYYWFPLEPHFRVPMFNWLPEPWRLSLVMMRGWGAFPRAETIEDAQRFIEDSTLLDLRRFRALFPDARIEKERVWGFVKSMIAVKG